MLTPKLIFLMCNADITHAPPHTRTASHTTDMAQLAIYVFGGGGDILCPIICTPDTHEPNERKKGQIYKFMGRPDPNDPIYPRINFEEVKATLADGRNVYRWRPSSQTPEGTPLKIGADQMAKVLAFADKFNKYQPIVVVENGQVTHYFDTEDVFVQV
jgi:hypothetical protein